MSSQADYNKTMGVIGGMGPEATKAFYERIIVALQKQYEYWQDSDYPYMYIINLPLPDVWHGKPEERDRVVSMLCTAAKQLEKNGCDFLAVPCNSAHLYFKHICNSVSIPVLNIIRETCEEAKSRDIKTIGLLATKTTIDERLYEVCFEESGIDVIRPPKYMQQKLEGIIDNILRGRKLHSDKKKVLEMIRYFRKEEAEAVVLGCTDLPLLVGPGDMDEVMLDTLQILVEAALQHIHPQRVHRKHAQ
jgi:aspartate racemase